MFDPNNAPIDEIKPEQAVPVESADVEAILKPYIDVQPDTPALNEGQSQKLADLIDRAGELTSAIEQFPDSPANYVLRGEIYLEGGDTDLAVADFETAIRLADQQAEAADWGYLYRAFADRAREGLRRA